MKALSRQLFWRTRLRLTLWYVGVMGTTVLAGGILLYHCLAVTERWWFDRTVEDLAGTLHDYLQPKLAQPGQLTPELAKILLGTGAHNDNLIGVTRLRNYYVRVSDPQGQVLLKSAFQPPGLPTDPAEQRWRTVISADGTRYRQIDDYLHTRDGQIWGYLQLGRSLSESDAHLQRLVWILVLSTPVAMLGVGIAGWWLAEVAMRPIQRSYDQIQRFTADAAHELRTPLSTTRTLAQSALSKAELGDPVDLNTLNVIVRQNERLTNLVADLLLISRLEESDPAFGSFQPCCLNDMISDLQEELAVLAQTHLVKLRLDLPESPIYTDGSEEQLYRLLMNLIANGIQYTPAGGSVIVRLCSAQSKVVFEVEDTGVGIPAEKMPHIYDRFYRVDEARARHSGGSGLGLSIAQAIAQAHHGSIQAQSQSGKGSTFTVTLPKSSAPVK